MNSFGINDLELWGEVPKEESLGTFGLQFACLSYGYLLNETQNQSFGIKLKGVYSKLYTEYMYGLLFDAGLKQNLNKNFNIGLTIKNIGYIQTDLAISSLPSEYGVGMSYNLNFTIDATCQCSFF